MESFIIQTWGGAGLRSSHQKVISPVMSPGTTHNSAFLVTKLKLSGDITLVSGAITSGETTLGQLDWLPQGPHSLIKASKSK